MLWEVEKLKRVGWMSLPRVSAFYTCSLSHALKLIDRFISGEIATRQKVDPISDHEVQIAISTILNSFGLHGRQYGSRSKQHTRKLKMKLVQVDQEALAFTSIDTLRICASDATTLGDVAEEDVKKQVLLKDIGQNFSEI